MSTFAQRLDQFSRMRSEERRRLLHQRRGALVRRIECKAFIFGVMVGAGAAIAGMFITSTLGG